MRARQNSYGNKTVKDIGDFVGHAEAKNQSLVWDSASLIAMMFRYHMPCLDKDAEIERAALRESSFAALKMHDPAAIKKIVWRRAIEGEAIAEKCHGQPYGFAFQH